MRDGRHVGDAGDFIAAAVKSTHCGLTTWTGTLDIHVKVFQTIFQRGLTSALCSHLGSGRGGLTRTAEARSTGGSPGQRIALTVSDGQDGVVKRGVDVSDPLNDCFFDLLTRTSSRFCHD